MRRRGRQTFKSGMAAATSRGYGGARWTKIESSSVWDAFCLVELIYDLINRQFLGGKCPNPVKIQLLRKVVVVEL